MSRFISVAGILAVIGVAAILPPAMPQPDKSAMAPDKSAELQNTLKRNETLKKDLDAAYQQLADLLDQREKDAKQAARRIGALETALKKAGVDVPQEQPGNIGMVDILNELIETKGLQEKVKLKVALEYFSDKFGGRVPILLDTAAFAHEFGENDSPYEEEVSLPPVPARMVFGTALRLICSQVAKGRATYLIRGTYVEIVPEKYSTAPHFIYQPIITAKYDGWPLSRVLHDLADKSGFSIDLDPGTGKKADTQIRTTFRNCSLEDALTPITEMAGLKYVVLNRSIYVTTKENAEAIREEEEQRAKKRNVPPVNKKKRLEPAAE